MCTLCALACPAQAASKERGPSKGLALLRAPTLSVFFLPLLRGRCKI